MFDTSELLSKLNMKRVDSPEGRIYQTPDGKAYSSVTTILSKKLNKPYLKEWRKAVGDEEADAVSQRGTIRGNKIHELAEKYLLNDPEWDKDIMLFNKLRFNSIKPLFDKHLSKVLGIELPLFSDELKAAGTTDIVCYWDGVLSIADIKTANAARQESEILDYFLQTCAYSIMLEEQYKLVAEQLVIIMAVDHDKPALFKVNRNKYLKGTRYVFA